MQVRRRSLSISGGPDVTKHCASCNRISDLDFSRIRVEVRVVVNAPAGADYGNGLAAESVLADVVDDALRGGENGSPARREDVLALMAASDAACGLPSGGNRSLRYVFQRHRELCVR